MNAREHRQDQRQRGDAVEETEDRAEPPRGPPDQRERGGVQDREDLTVHEMDEGAHDPRAIRLLHEDGAEHHRDVHAAEACQLRQHHDPREENGRDESERGPSGPVHRR